MSWLRLDDNAVDHPKIVGLSDRAFRAWVRGSSYCCRLLTDGTIPAGVAASLADKKTRTELLDAGLWKGARDKGDIEVHDFLDFNRKASDVKEERRRKSEGGKKGNEARWGHRLSDRITNQISNRIPESPRPAPTQPGEDLNLESVNGKAVVPATAATTADPERARRAIHLAAISIKPVDEEAA